MNVQQNYAHILPQAGFSKYREVVEGISPVEGMGNFAGRYFFSLVTNSNLRLKMNICILELSILFFKDLLLLCYIQVIGL